MNSYHGGELTFACVRIQRYDTPDVQSYAAVRQDELAAVLARSDRVETVQECSLGLPPDVAAAFAAELAAPLRPVLAGIGTVGDGDTWVTGPLEGQRRPNPWDRLKGFEGRMAPGYRCRYVSRGGHRCDNVVAGAEQRCLAHQPGTRWETWEALPPGDGQDDGA